MSISDCQDVQQYTIALTWCSCKRSAIEFKNYSDDSYKKQRNHQWNNLLQTKCVADCTLKVKNVPQCMIYYLGNIVHNEAYQETEENSMTPLYLACGNRMEMLWCMYLENTTMQQHYMTQTEIFLSIWPAFGMNICQQVLCIISWICSGKLLGVKQTMTTHFHCITLCKAILPVLTNYFS